MSPATDAARLDWAATALGHRFADPALLKRALTHSSVGGPNYQRLEFLGDRILGALIAGWLYDEFDEPEGALTQRYHALVEDRLRPGRPRHRVADHMIVDRAASGIARSDNVLGDVAEALLAALWLDGGWPAAERFVRAAWTPLVEAVTAPAEHPKSRLQRWAQQHGLPLPTYAVVRREGPHHAPRFAVEVAVRGHPPAAAEGPNRQEAETAAAAALLAAVAT